MITILCQDKKRLVEVNNVNISEVKKNGNIQLLGEYSNSQVLLGEYETEARAEQILLNMTSVISTKSTIDEVKGHVRYTGKTVYVMPYK